MTISVRALIHTEKNAKETSPLLNIIRNAHKLIGFSGALDCQINWRVVIRGVRFSSFIRRDGDPSHPADNFRKMNLRSPARVHVHLHLRWLNPYSATLKKNRPLEVVGRGSETQLQVGEFFIYFIFFQVGEKYSYLFNLRRNVCQFWW